MLISVVIPCRNEKANITECVEAIYASKLTGGVSIEVLLIDGLSDDGTIEVIAKLQKSHTSLKLIENKKQVTPVAFNLGIKAAKGDFIQIIGARQVVSNNYLQGCLDVLINDDDTWCVGGVVQNIYQTDESENIGLAMASPFGVGGGNFRVAKKSEFTDTVGTPMYKSDVFNKIGFFNENLVRNQDDEFNYRVTSNGGKIFLSSEINIKYYVRASVSKLFKQYMQYGYWKVYVNKLHRTVTSMRQLIPLIFVFGVIFGAILSVLVPYFVFVYIGGLLLYMVIAFFFGVRISKELIKGGKVALMFPVLHWGYGYGYLKGIIHFLVLGKKPTNKSKELSRS